MKQTKSLVSADKVPARLAFLFISCIINIIRSKYIYEHLL